MSSLTNLVRSQGQTATLARVILAASGLLLLAGLWVGGVRITGLPLPALALMTLSLACAATAMVMIDQFRQAADRRSDTLSAAVAQAEVDRRQAIQERDQARLADRARVHFLTQMNHDLRTPLNAILGYAMLLAEDAEADGNHAAIADLARIRKASQHLLTLLEDLAQLSTIGTGQVQRVATIVETSNLLERLSEEHAEAAFSIKIGKDAELLITDPDLCLQCLRSILRWFGKAGPPALRVHTASAPGALPQVRFQLLGAVLDGEIDQVTAFSNDWQSRAQTLAASIGGNTGFMAQAGEQVEAWLELPLRGVRRDMRRVREEFVPAALTQLEKPASTVSRTALVIDDHGPSRELMGRWLERQHFKVVPASNGEDGFRLAKELRPALIVLDIHMPGRSGHEVLRDLRGDEDCRDIPVIVVTVDDDRAQVLESGATEFVRKPASEKQIGEIVKLYRDPSNGEILIIDDDENFADLIGRYARQVGYDVVHATDGDVGIAKLKESRPAAIVLDLRMPKTSGFGVLEFLRNDEQLSTTPVIVMTAGDIDLDDYRRLTNAGCRFTPKGSLSPREIAAQLREIAA